MAEPACARIDIHIHLAGAGPTPDPEEMDRCIRLARHYGIGRAVHLFNLNAQTGGYDPTPEAIQLANTHTLGAMAARPEFFIGFCYLNPAHDPSFLRDEIERTIVEGGMRGIKLWVAVKATDPRVDPILQRAAELGVPVLHHAWYKQTDFAFNESVPADIAEMGRRHPNTNIIMAHLSGGGWRGVLDVADTPNVHVDTSGAQPEAGIVEYAVRHLGADRIVFGSDWYGRDFGVQVARVLGAGLSPDDRYKVFTGNALRLLGLGEDAS
jgi:uncharacterized protein